VFAGVVMVPHMLILLFLLFWFAIFEPHAKGEIMVTFGNYDLISAQGVGKISIKSVIND